MQFRVGFGRKAREDLLALYDHIAADAGAERGMDYAGRVERACLGLADFPARGAPRDDIRPGLRVLAFQRRVLIGYTVADAEVRILRNLYGGRQFGDDDPA